MSTPTERQSMPICDLCEHGNDHVRTVTTLIRRRRVVECGSITEPVSGLTGGDRCPCRAPFHAAAARDA